MASNTGFKLRASSVIWYSTRGGSSYVLKIILLEIFMLHQ